MESESTTSKTNPIDFNPLVDEMTSVKSSQTSNRKIFFKCGNWKTIFLGTTGLKYRNPDTQVSIDRG